MESPDDRLRLLERAQHLHDAVLERHEAEMAEKARRLARLEDLIAQQTLTHRALVDGFGRLETALLAIKDLLERGRNGRDA